jgi:hypothetical protein
MEALNALFHLVDSWGVLSSLKAPTIHFWVSLYADNLIIFITPIEHDLCCVPAILEAFTEASGLCSNILKSQFTPIQCTLLFRSPVSWDRNHLSSQLILKLALLHCP